jgi:hypothetical protein
MRSHERLVGTITVISSPVRFFESHTPRQLQSLFFISDLDSLQHGVRPSYCTLLMPASFHACWHVFTSILRWRGAF